MLHPRYIEILEECKQLSDRKNLNYATDEDPLSNLRASQDLGFKASDGVAMRMQDKIKRWIELRKGKPDEVGESIVDTLKDLINYAAFEILFLEEEAKK